MILCIPILSLLLFISESAHGVGLLLGGVSFSGKTTLMRALEEELAVERVVQYTSRRIRTGEIEGDAYHFRSRAEMKELQASGEIWQLYEFDGELYGVPSEVIFSDRNWVADISSSQLSSYREIPGVVSIFLETPSEEELLRRARGRGDSEAAIQRRMRLLQGEEPDLFDHLLPANSTVSERVAKIRTLF